MGWAGERASKINEIWMLERDRKSLKIWWFSLPKSRKRERNTLRKTLFFSLVFCNRFWVGLGMVLGGFRGGSGASWSLLGQFLASFFEACTHWKVLSWFLAPFWKVRSWIWLHFGRYGAGFWLHFGRYWTGFRLHFEGLFGSGLGRTLGGFWESLEGYKLQFSWNIE